MNKLLKDMLVGTLLGDASIRRTGLDKAYITFEQSGKKSEYLNYLYNLAKEQGLPLMSDTVKEYTRSDSRYGTKNTSLYFRTESLEELKPLADLFLDESGKKIIHSSISDHLSERSLAFWIMDDGQQVKRGGVTLCTDSFKSDEVSLLRESLKSNFNLITSIHNKKSSSGSTFERIYINKDSLDLIKPNLIPHMHETMLYKVNALTEFKQDTADFVSEYETITDIDMFDT